MVPLRFPPFVTASKWSTVNSQLWDMVQRKRGKHLARYPETDGRGGIAPTLAPLLTNGDVVRLVMAWLAALPRARVRELFPLWAQFAAAAYGWDPKTNRFDASVKRRNAAYPDVLLVELWKTLMGIASDLDAELVPGPRLDLDGDFADPVFQAEVKAELQADGASAQFKIPLPACRTKDGKVQLPKCKRHMKRWPYLCEEWERCEPVVIDDPITDVKKKTEKTILLVALVLCAWAVFDNQPRHRRK